MYSDLSENSDGLRQSLDFQTKLNQAIKRIHSSNDLADLIENVAPLMLELMQAERLSIYQRGKSNKDIVSKFLVGDELKEIRVPLSASTIAGFVALTKEPVRISNVYNKQELAAIHEDLKFGSSFDVKSGYKTRSVIGIPILNNDVLLGVLQFLNPTNKDDFNDSDLSLANELASVLSQKFRYELQGTQHPYDFLVQKKKITPEQLDEFKKRAPKEGTTLNELILSEAGVSKAELGASFENFYQVPYQPYDQNIEIPQDVLNGVNLAFLEKQLWAPIHVDGKEVTIVIDDPTDARKIMEIQRTIPGMDYVFKVALQEDILKFLSEDTYEEDATDLHELVGQLNEETEDDEAEEVVVCEENEATLIRLVNKIIHDAQEAGGSDIHIEPGKGKANASIRVRVDGECRSSLTIPYTHVAAVISRIKIISGLDITERRLPQDGKCVVKYKGKPLELRVATVPTVNGESAVLRILASSEPLPLEKMNFSERNEKHTKELTSLPYGIFLVVGPTGSGKTTTLHSILGNLNVPEKKIWTAEDPVEITQAGLQQVQMKPKVGLTFASALRSFLRADPDIIMIGEMRDKETAHMGIEASLTGHLVLSTLHTNSAPETITRLLDLGIDPVNFSDALLGVLAQRLVRTLCSDCKEEYEITEEEVEVLRRYYGEEHFDELGVEAGKTVICRAKGCPKCGSTGYRGRTGVHELLVNSPEMTEAIYKESSIAEIKGLALKQGMRTLMQDGIQKLLKGQTDLEQIRKVAAG